MPDGHTDRPRREAGRSPEAIHPGGLPADGEPARPGHRGQRLHPDPVAFGRDGLYEGRLVPEDAEGRICTSDGYLLDPSITIPQTATAVTIANDGTVSVQQQGQTALQQIGTLNLWTFPNVARVERHRQEPLPADGRERRRPVGDCRPERLRHDPPGIPGAVERQRHAGDGQPYHRTEGI